MQANGGRTKIKIIKNTKTVRRERRNKTFQPQSVTERGEFPDSSNPLCQKSRAIHRGNYIVVSGRLFGLRKVWLAPFVASRRGTKTGKDIVHVRRPIVPPRLRVGNGEWRRQRARVRPHAGGGGARGRTVPHLRSVPDDGCPGVAQFVPARSFIVVDQQKIVLRSGERQVVKRLEQTAAKKKKTNELTLGPSHGARSLLRLSANGKGSFN